MTSSSATGCHLDRAVRDSQHTAHYGAVCAATTDAPAVDRWTDRYKQRYRSVRDRLRSIRLLPRPRPDRRPLRLLRLAPRPVPRPPGATPWRDDGDRLRRSGGDLCEHLHVLLV